jgi:CubicO group peptidase (beta-lactamase class C family)
MKFFFTVVCTNCVIYIITLLIPNIVNAYNTFTKPDSISAYSDRYSAILNIIKEFEHEIPTKLDKEDVPGFAMAVVVPDIVLWSKCYGYSDDDRKKPVDFQTIFSVQSISKTYTATAIMHAAQNGILDLNVPIKQYLPNFTVNSPYNKDPFSIITLKHLLNHRAGFTHEAPIGNNFDASFNSFEEHVFSIQNTWLKFPVGEQYSYSNLGIDIAGYILEKVSGLPFHVYVRINILEPLGMMNSSFNTDWILSNKNRAIGHDEIFIDIPEAIPIIPSGGFYSSINDMARYVQFHLNKGMVGDSVILLEPEWLDTMYTIPFAYPGQKFGYGLGIGLRGVNKSLMLNHGGGGFGFLSLMMWFPEYDFGIITLSNTTDHNLQDMLAMDLGERILNHIKKQRGIAEEPDLTGFPPTPPRKSLPVEFGPNKTEWQKYTGLYRIKAFGQAVWKIDLKIINGYLNFNGQQLEEHLPGLFFDPDGEAIDMRGKIPTYRNIRMVKINIPTFAKVSLIIVVVVLLMFIVGWPVIYLCKKHIVKMREGSQNKWPIAYTITGYLISLIILSYAYLLIYEIPFALYETYPWYYRYPIYIKIVLLMPFMATFMGVILLITSFGSWRKILGIRTERILYSLLAAASLIFILLLIHWQQFGTFG